MGQIRETIIDYCMWANEQSTLDWEERHRGSSPRLFVSDIGGCAKKAHLNAYKAQDGHPLQRKPSHLFEPDLLELFELGNFYEEMTWRQLEWRFRGSIVREMPLDNGVWAGRADYVIAQCEQYPEGAIIDNKGTNPYNFSKNLPYTHHLYQVLMYQRMLEGAVGYAVPAWLYYRDWNFWAEIEVASVAGGVWWGGEINGTERDSTIFSPLEEEIKRVEEGWGGDTLPQGYATPFEARFGCTKYAKGRKGYKEIACQWFGVCWPDETPRDGSRLLEVKDGW